MSARAAEPSEPGDDPVRSQGPALRAASLSALEEAVRHALDAASREQVIEHIANVLPPTAKPDLQGNVQKVSVSMPTELARAVRQRTGHGGFSRYVSDAVEVRFRHDALGDLLDELDAEYGPVRPASTADREYLWPDEEP
jgi:hypothetical protein